MTTAKAYTNFLAKGGTVTVLPGFMEIKPLPAAKHPKKPSEDSNDYSDWYSSKDIRKIVGIPDNQHYKICNAIVWKKIPPPCAIYKGFRLWSPEVISQVIEGLTL